MTDATDQYLRDVELRLRALDQEIEEKERERAVLRRLRAERLSKDILLPGEQLTARTQKKLEVLSAVLIILRRSTYSNGRPKGMSSNDIHKQLERDFRLNVNYGTLRSYLTRAKAEGRLDHDTHKGGWIPKTAPRLPTL